MRPPDSMRTMRIGSASPSSQSSAPGATRSGQSVSSSTRTAPARPLAPRILATARRRSVGVGDDLELDVSAVLGGHHLEQAADRVGDASVAADDATHVLLIDAEGEDRLVAVLVDLDEDRVGLVDQPLVRRIRETLSRVCLLGLCGLVGRGLRSLVCGGRRCLGDLLGGGCLGSLVGRRLGCLHRRSRPPAQPLPPSAAGASAAFAAFAFAFADAFGLVARVARFGFSAAAGSSAARSAWRISLATVSDGWAPLPIQALIRAVSRLTVAGSVSGS